jgi:hypothetical protein
MPGTPTTYAPPAPPTAANAAAVQAAADAKQKALEKSGINSTLLSQLAPGQGDPTGTLLSSGGAQKKNSLLGGG